MERQLGTSTICRDSDGAMATRSLGISDYVELSSLLPKRRSRIACSRSYTRHSVTQHPQDIKRTHHASLELASWALLELSGLRWCYCAAKNVCNLCRPRRYLAREAWSRNWSSVCHFCRERRHTPGVDTCAVAKSGASEMSIDISALLRLESAVQIGQYHGQTYEYRDMHGVPEQIGLSRASNAAGDFGSKPLSRRCLGRTAQFAWDCAARSCCSQAWAQRPLLN